MAKKKDEQELVQVQIEPIKAETIKVPIVGVTPLIVNRFSAKAKQQMLDGMTGQKKPKQAKDPDADYEGSLYRFKGDEGFGVPAQAFKNSMVGATRLFPKAVTMVLVRQTIFVHGDPGDDGQPLVRIVGEPAMREDVVRVGVSGHDLRYRAEFREWRAEVSITYVQASFARGSVLTLLDAAGLGVGVGEWRPERSGNFGTFKIDETQDVEVVV